MRSFTLPWLIVFLPHKSFRPVNTDVWIVYGEFGLHELSPNKTEVIDVKWMDMKEILLLNQYGYLHPLLDYVDVNFFKEEIK